MYRKKLEKWKGIWENRLKSLINPLALDIKVHTEFQPENGTSTTWWKYIACFFTLFFFYFFFFYLFYFYRKAIFVPWNSVIGCFPGLQVYAHMRVQSHDCYKCQMISHSITSYQYSRITSHKFKYPAGTNTVYWVPILLYRILILSWLPVTQASSLAKVTSFGKFFPRGFFFNFSFFKCRPTIMNNYETNIDDKFKLE